MNNFMPTVWQPTWNGQTDFLKIKLQKLTQEEISNGIALTLVKKMKL